VTVFERMSSLGRKFLLAGRGGLNLTHTEPMPAFLARYGGAGPRLRPVIEAFPPDALRAWCEELGQPTFVGSSGRVFPAAFKASPLLRAWLRRLAELGVTFRLRHRWCGWAAEHGHRFETLQGDVVVRPHAAVLALGGASWPQLGSDGSWTGVLRGAGLEVAPLRPANCGFLVPWSPHFAARFEGAPLSGIALRFADRVQRGEAVVTRSGIEGGAVYALSARLREALAERGEATLLVDLRPGIAPEVLMQRLASRSPKLSLSNALRKTLNLSPVAIGLLHEAARASGRPLGALQPAELAALIRGVPLPLTGTAPLARAISTAGGLALAELDGRFMLRSSPGLFAAGEMLDWEAPTGGHLLQACFATGAAAGRGALAWLAEQDVPAGVSRRSRR
jgi:uncharacterized flavoprotein (TIGR03862 family)